MANNVDTVLFTLPGLHQIFLCFQRFNFLPSQVGFCAFKKNLFTFKLQLSPFIGPAIYSYSFRNVPLFPQVSTFILLVFYLYLASVTRQRENRYFQPIPMKVKR